jgi:hypothetical protein
MLTYDNWTLKDMDYKPVSVGDKYQDFRGDTHVIEGGRPPHKPSSTGRIWTNKGEFFPGVCNLTWIKE